MISHCEKNEEIQALTLSTSKKKCSPLKCKSDSSRLTFCPFWGFQVLNIRIMFGNLEHCALENQ